MTEIGQERHDTVSFAGGVLDLDRHVCAFVNSRDEEHQILDPFVNEGLARGDKLLYIVDPAQRANLVHHLRHLGHDMPTLLRQRRCEVRTWSETYLPGGRVDRDAMLRLLDELLGDPRSPRIRLIVDMGWADGEQDLSDLLLEYEARANYVQHKHEHVVVCVYDTAKFGGDIVIDVLRTHPMALVGGVLQMNPFFVPAAEFLEEVRSLTGDLQMVDADPPTVRAAEEPIMDGTDSLVASRRGLRDLAALLALPTMWVDHDPADIAVGLLDVLFSVLRLESGYVRFDDPAGSSELERWRPTGPRVPTELEPVLTATPARERGAVTVSVANPSGDGAVRVTSMFPALPGEDGLVLVGSRRTDFPTDLELHLLRVAVCQATILIHTARRLASERAARFAAETALRRRNAFLATLARDLTLPFKTLSQHAAQAHAFATELAQPHPLTSMEADFAVGVGAGHRSENGISAPASPARLTRREGEVLGLLAQGLSNREIAGLMWLSERTVERHITGLYRKIGVARRSEATAFALRHRLVDANAHEA